MKLLTSCWYQVVLALALFVSNSAQATTIVLDSTNSNNAVVLNLAVGSYNFTYVSGAWNRWSAVDGCDANGEHCTHGWVNTIRVESPQYSGWFGDGMVYATAAQAEASGKANFTFPFDYTTAGPVTLSLYDGYYADNTGSITISITAVPEPETYVMLLAGLAIVGAMVVRGRSAGNGSGASFCAYV
ncbi:PEP-CTERM sorting domain-containing protein [Pseudoduganella sp. FT93W]|uniref:PEP-CTERM sorting domain-containing protein n=1 Tax=Duganella fentianensis TaxID=2692177 RepID=A0A845HV49_9BURK|nr:PEP-CTERM sorting domain-containing protein [Duganella fentianensis]MYN44883.1 PEP-CTERM sorting domain-containing protein [Duganella fentianensis]